MGSNSRMTAVSGKSQPIGSAFSGTPNGSRYFTRVGDRRDDLATAVDVPLENGWRPQWLRRTVLVIFAVVFALFVCASELILHFVSTEVRTKITGVWTFGPVISEW